MDANGWGRLRKAWDRIVAAGPEHAAEAVREHCGDDEEAAGLLRRMLKNHFELDGTRGTAELPHVIAGRFRVFERLGGGAFGDVYRVADQNHGGAVVALKVLRSSDP